MKTIVGTEKRDTESVVDVRIRGTVRGIAAGTLKRRALKLLSALALDGVELSVVLCNDAFIQTLNRDFRGKNKPTDVLSFPQSDAPAPPFRILGDVVISVETAMRQATAAGHSLRTECSMLLIHGILHLVGHTHEDDRDEAVMNREAARLLTIVEKHL